MNCQPRYETLLCHDHKSVLPKPFEEQRLSTTSKKCTDLSDLLADFQALNCKSKSCIVCIGLGNTAIPEIYTARKTVMDARIKGLAKYAVIHDEHNSAIVEPRVVVREEKTIETPKKRNMAFNYDVTNGLSGRGDTISPSLPHNHKRNRTH